MSVTCCSFSSYCVRVEMLFLYLFLCCCFFFFKQKTAYEMRISDWSSDVCSSDLDHTTIYRWVQCYAPEMEKRLRWFWRRGFDPSWRLDETYVKVRGKWTYLYRAVDKRGDTIDFYLSPTRSAKAAKRFLGKALRGLKHWEK